MGCDSVLELSNSRPFVERTSTVHKLQEQQLVKSLTTQVVSDFELIQVIVDIGETVYCRLVAEAAVSRDVACG